MERDIFIISVYCLVVETMQIIENNYIFRRKGFLDEYQHKLWDDVQQTQVITPVRKKMESSPEQVKLVRKTSYWRKLVETVGSQLTERFQISKIKVKDLWHYQNRIFRKILSHTVGVFLNMQHGNKPLQLALLAEF